jgi:hypothetical protein
MNCVSKVIRVTQGDLEKKYKIRKRLYQNVMSIRVVFLCLLTSQTQRSFLLAVKNCVTVEAP